MSKVDFVPVNKPLLKGNEKKYLIECIETGWISSEGPFVEKFEAEFASLVNRKHAIAVTNGTSAIDAAIESLNIESGDEVIIPTFTIISCVHQIIRKGAIPVLVDSDAETWNMDVSQIESKITTKTKAIMIVHIYGLPVDVDPVIKIANQYNLKIIEDAAEMHGQNYRSKPCGSFGDVSTFSFYPNKHITSGEGGMIVTDNDEIADSCRSLRNLCFQEGKRFVHERLGWNLRMSNIQAAVGLAQLENLQNFVKYKRAMGEKYKDRLKNVSSIQLPLSETDYAKNIYWVFGLVLNSNSKLNAESVMKKLNKKGIGTRPFFCPMHLQPVLKKMGLFKGESYPIAEHLYKNGFYIPSGMDLSDDEIDFVTKSVIEVLN
jgi:perosamine synthetase